MPRWGTKIPPAQLSSKLSSKRILGFFDELLGWLELRWKLVGLRGLEPPTRGLGNRCSIP